jgi:glycosyltransferase involved in cell wall biosynthesis
MTSSGGRIRLAIVTTHPIQYNAPAFARLAAMPDLDVRVFYEWGGTGTTCDPEFGREVTWDVPLLDGYEYAFVPNVARKPGSHHFRGIDNPTLPDLIEDWGADVLLLYGWAFASHMRILRHFNRKVPILFRGDSHLLDEVPGARQLARRTFLRMVYRMIDVALYPGQASRAYFRAHGVPESALMWAPHAVDNDRFMRSPQDRERDAREWRDTLGIPAQSVVFLFTGKLVPRKDPALLLNAFRDLGHSSLGERSHLIFCGDGELHAFLRSASAGDETVHFLDFQNQSIMPVVYRLGDVTVVPSAHGETWGLAVNESMASQRPVIASDRVGCAGDLIDHERTGFVFPNRDKEALADLLSRTQNRALELRNMGVEAQARIGEWSIAFFADRTAEAARRTARRALPSGRSRRNNSR